MLVKMEVYYDGEVWCARGVDHDIFAQGRTRDEAETNILEAVALHFGDEKPEIDIRVL